MYLADKVFENRRDAGRRLAEALSDSAEYDLVLALPRGGVPVAYEVATALGLPLDVLIVRKIGAPGHPEFGLGAVVDGSDPQVVLNARIVDEVRPHEGYIEAETQRQLDEITRRRQAYVGERQPEAVAGRNILLVDDGIATGGTAMAALQALRKAGAARVTLAVPVAPGDSLDELAAEADDIVCLSTPTPFRAVGLHYADFDQTRDEEVIELLRKARAE